tara:strand:+ start:157 stop:426 length:270 start_codon:yes stop_codon:yes gene_type:complete
MLDFFKVKGNSMLPALKDGQYVLTKNFKDYKLGEIVIINSSSNGYLIKRISSICGSSIRVKGDNLKLESSACDQNYSIDEIYGKVISVI